MKNIVKIILFVVLIVVFCGLVTGCGKKGNCYSCGQYEKLEKYQCHNYDGTEGATVWLCEDCRRYWKAFGM